MPTPRLVLAVLLACGSAPLAACDLDGLPGFHRANPFARAPIFRGAPAAPAEPPAQGDPQGAKPAEKPAPASAPAPRAWERSDNPGPISAEDKALFS